MKSARDASCAVKSDYLKERILSVEDDGDAIINSIQSFCSRLKDVLSFSSSLSPSSFHAYLLAWKVVVSIPRIAQTNAEKKRGSGEKGKGGGKEKDLVRNLRNCGESFLGSSKGLVNEFLQLLSVCAHTLLSPDDDPFSTSPSSLSLSSSVVDEKIGNTTRGERGWVYKRMKEWEGEWGLSSYGGEGEEEEEEEEVGGASSESLSALCQAIFVEAFSTRAQGGREWYQFLDRGSKIIVEKLFANRYSPLFTSSASRSLRKQIENGGLETDEFRVTVMGSEVKTFYEVDETELSLNFQVPPLYPLQVIEVHVPSCRMGVNESQWRRWILAQTTLLRQGGDLVDAVHLSKVQVERHFQGIENCFICYCVFHSSSKSLPRLACHTCKNKFHSACLYRWFHTSQKSVCPLCQSLWTTDL